MGLVNEFQGAEMASTMSKFIFPVASSFDPPARQTKATLPRLGVGALAAVTQLESM